MKTEVTKGIARSGLAVAALLAATLLPAAQGAFAAADTLSLAPTADAWVTSTSPTDNFGTVTNLKARVGVSESYVRFNLTAWQGLRVASLKFTLTGLSGNMNPLRLATTDTTWAETAVSWNTRPAAVTPLAAAPTVSSGKATFDVGTIFPSGVIDTLAVSLRVSTPNDLLVTFSSREVSSSSPRLTLDVASRTNTVDLPPTADTWADATATGANYGDATSLSVASGVKKEAFLKFDLSAWSGRGYTALRLRLPLTAPTGPSVSAYKVSTAWHESSLTWANRPTGGTLLGAFTTNLDPGARTLDVSSAFASWTVEAPVLAIRLVGTDVATMVVSSRESSVAPVLRLFPGTGTPPPTPTPTPVPTATPVPTPTPGTGSPQFYFAGKGTDHGVGLSQTGAKGRANAGHTFDDIIHAYYTDVTLAPVPPERETIRVQLSSAFVPTATEPARVVARNGAWQSEAFPGQTFAADTYLDMVLGQNGWQAKVRDPSGDVVASTETTDLTMTPAEPTTLFYMKFRDSLRKYDLYRGSMRLRVNGAGIQSINIVSMEHYVQGVVPAEMIPSWPIEALKAQAIIARSYGASKVRTTGFYDVVPTSTNQVYGGVNLEFTKTNNATSGTAGLIVWTGAKIAATYFFETAGGHTENSEYVWSTKSGSPGVVIPHVRGIEDVNRDGVPFDINAVSYEWQTGQFTMAQLSNIFARDSRTNVGTISNLTYYRGVSGRLYKVTLAGTAGTKNVSGAIFKSAYNKYRLAGSPAAKSTMMYLTPVNP